MKATTIITLISELIPLIIFNVIFFLFGGTEHLPSVWLSYGFMHFAYIMVVLTPLLTNKGRSAAVFSFSIYSVSTVYFIIEFIIGLIFVFIALEEILIPLVIQLIIAGIYLIILLSVISANIKTSTSEVNRNVEIVFIKSASSKLDITRMGISDVTLRRKLDNLYDLLSSSPVKSHPDVKLIEEEIISDIHMLSSLVRDGEYEKATDTISQIQNLILERNIGLRR